MNNPDIVQEIRLITNQFTAEYGRAAGSVMNIITKSGTNEFPRQRLLVPQRQQLQFPQQSRCCRRPYQAPVSRGEPVGGTFGGPVARADVFFESYQRWTDRRQGSGITLAGAPSEAGEPCSSGSRRAAAGRGPVAALAGRRAERPIGQHSRSRGQTYTVPLGSSPGRRHSGLDDDQASGRVDHQITAGGCCVGRYLFSDTSTDDPGGVQVTPPGLTSNGPGNRRSLNVSLNSVFGSSHDRRTARGLVAPRHRDRNR